jgi:quercetin dioxygenase-like cupin family protein
MSEQVNTENLYNSPVTAIPGFFKISDIPAIELAPGVSLQLLSGEKTMMSIVTFQPGTFVPLHSHPHEQLGTTLQGEMLLYIGGLEEKYAQVVKAGDTYVIPGGVLHAARPLGDGHCIVLDVFSPPREDYLEKFRALHQREVPGLSAG